MESKATVQQLNREKASEKQHHGNEICDNKILNFDVIKYEGIVEYELFRYEDDQMQPRNVYVKYSVYAIKI